MKALIFAFVVSLASTAALAAGHAMTVHPANPRYFADPTTGAPLFLTGTHTWSNVVEQGGSDPPRAFPWSTYLDWISGRGYNFVRFWVISLPKAGPSAPYDYCELFPWVRTGQTKATDGKPQFNLSTYNQVFFDRLRSRVTDLKKKNMFCSVMLFEGYGITLRRHSSDGFPLDSRNNTQGIGVAGTGSEALTLSYPAITAAEEAYVKKTIDTLHDQNNVIWRSATRGLPDHGSGRLT